MLDSEEKGKGDDQSSSGDSPRIMQQIFPILQELTGQRIPFTENKGFLQEHRPFTSGGIGHSQLNELLLTLGYDRISTAFFRYCFGDGSIDSYDSFTKGVEKFRKDAILLYGNVKFAFKTLAPLNEEGLQKALTHIKPVPVDHYARRHHALNKIKKISGSDTYYLGYLIAQELYARLQDNPADEKAISEQKRMLGMRRKGKSNHKTYLTYDHMDVYIATSMREKHEYYLVHGFIEKLFQHESLKALKLRWFDPTQAYCDDRIDKGLVEALMLKRAKCTIYHVQETDTLGKDSELAATLAQGKPVIAYIPKLNDPVEFMAQATALARELYPGANEPELLLHKFLRLYYPEGAWKDSKVQGWLMGSNDFDIKEAAELLFQKAQQMYEKRATTLKETHPLGLQVNLGTGVANGVLVVRTLTDCARLLRNIMLNEMEFDLEKAGVNGKFTWCLRERISGCIYRAVTGDELLTNTFWNFYLESSQ